MSSPQSDYDQALTRRVLWKLDCRILPPLALLWLANFIDRSNIGNARISGLERDTHLRGNQFNAALAVFYVTYLLVEIPSNMVMKKMKPNRWIPLLVFLWGIVTTLTALIHSFNGLIAIRLCLGLCEGGLLPGIVLYLSTIYKRHELQLRVGIFYASASLSGAFGGLLATAIIKMDGIGGLAGWRWIFILEGLATILASIIAALVLPTDIASANFLSEEEKAFAIRRFWSRDVTGSSGRNFDSDANPPNASAEKDVEKKDETQDASVAELSVMIGSTFDNHDREEFEWGEVIRGFKDPQAWLTGIAYCGLIVSLYSYSLFLPTIVSGLGYRGGAAQLHTVPPYVPAVVLTVIIAVLADKLKWRGPFILLCLPLTVIGYIMAITAKTNTVRYTAVFFMAAGVYPSGPCILSILPNNSSGHYKKATTTALQLAVANTGGFIATFVYTQDQAPKYIRGHSVVLAFVILAWVLIAANVSYCMWENKARREGRRDINLRLYKELWDARKTRAPIGDRHPRFYYTL